ncbi:MAG: 16S rRNA processing protein RimM [Odoribacteraceae bacterium]|jgi:16S rRNA processing protein RimM|nr:16S rRNA processing protein RimM [Odoribacteraceae bacterium]
MIDEKDHASIGKIGHPYRSRGEVIVYTGRDLRSFQPTEPVFLHLEGAPVPFYIARGGVTRRNATSFIVKFDYIDSIEQAGRIAGLDLFAREERPGVEEEEHEHVPLPGLPDVIGFSALDLLTGETGEVVDAANYAGNILLSIRLHSREILLPFSGAYIKEIVPGERLLRVEIPLELKELNY